MQNLHCFEPDRSDPEGIGCVLLGPTVARSSSSVPSAFSLRMSDFGPERSTSCSWKQRSQAADPIDEFFFHEYGRRVGMSRLSLKERKIQSDARTWPELIRPIRKCQVASAPHQSNPTVLSKGEKSQPGVRAGCTAATTLLSRNLKIKEQEVFPKCTSPQEVPLHHPVLHGAMRFGTQLQAICKQPSFAGRCQ